MTGQYHPHGSVGQADCILGQAFGLRFQDGAYESGAVNDGLMLYMTRYLPDLPAYLQADFHTAFDWFGDDREVHWTGKLGERISSRQVLIDQLAQMRRDGRSRPVLLDVAYQVPRVQATARQLGIDPIVPSGLPRGFDPQSTQFWTRSNLRWQLKEPFVIAHHFVHGWLQTS